MLLDENLPHDLRHEIVGHECQTARYVGLVNVRNGTLLRLAAAQGFEVLLTLDQGFAHQHNRQTLPMAVVILEIGEQSKLFNIRPLLDRLHIALADIKPCTVMRIGLT